MICQQRLKYSMLSMTNVTNDKSVFPAASKIVCDICVFSLVLFSHSAVWSISSPLHTHTTTFISSSITCVFNAGWTGHTVGYTVVKQGRSMEGVSHPYISKDIVEVSHTHKIKAPLLYRSAKNNPLHQPDWNTPDHTQSSSPKTGSWPIAIVYLYYWSGEKRS